MNVHPQQSSGALHVITASGIAGSTPLQLPEAPWHFKAAAMEIVPGDSSTAGAEPVLGAFVLHVRQTARESVWQADPVQCFFATLSFTCASTSHFAVCLLLQHEAWPAFFATFFGFPACAKSFAGAATLCALAQARRSAGVWQQQLSQHCVAFWQPQRLCMQGNACDVSLPAGIGTCKPMVPATYARLAAMTPSRAVARSRQRPVRLKQVIADQADELNRWSTKLWTAKP
jgi:hypothetical protein